MRSLPPQAVILSCRVFQDYHMQLYYSDRSGTLFSEILNPRLYHPRISNFRQRILAQDKGMCLYFPIRQDKGMCLYFPIR